jgi:hypothetical protein
LSTRRLWTEVRIMIKAYFFQGRQAFSSSIISFNWAGVYPTPPITPRPPALETAAAKRAPDVCPIPARKIGC